MPDGLAIAAWVGDKPLDTVVARALEEWQPRSGSVVVFTNAVADSREYAVVDARRLSQVVESDPELRLRMPSLLGVCDDALFDGELVTRSTADVGAARELARVFVPTRAYRAAIEALGRHSFAVLTGPPEMGKTAAARMIGLARLSGGWELHECTRPEQLWAAFARDRPQVFVADDAFGSTEYRPDAAEHWAVELDRILRAMDERHWLVWTSRPAPLKAGLRRIHREHGVERFPQPAEVQVDASALDLAEKALILYRHARTAGLPRATLDAVRLHGWEIVSHEHFTPERIRRFVHLDAVRSAQSTVELAQLVDAAIREPTAAMSASFHALEPAQRAVLVALLDSPAGAVSDRELAAAVRRHAAAALGQRSEELLDRLTDHFVRVGEGGVVTWVHPSWRDLVIEELAAHGDLRREFLAAASIDGLLLALSTGGGARGERALPLLLEDADWDALADGVTRSPLEEPDVKRLLLALREAFGAVDEGRRAELDAFATAVLELLRRRWTSTVPVGLLADWFELSQLVREAPPAPDVAATWFEYLPVVGGVDPRSPTDLADLTEWVGLVELLRERSPEVLVAFGYPGSVGDALAAFADAVWRDPVPGVSRLLGRLADVCPPLADRLEAVRVAAVRALRPEPEETYVPRPISAELTALLDAPPVIVDHDHAVVRRVLHDL